MKWEGAPECSASLTACQHGEKRDPRYFPSDPNNGIPAIGHIAGLDTSICRRGPADLEYTLVQRFPSGSGSDKYCKSHVRDASKSPPTRQIGRRRFEASGALGLPHSATKSTCSRVPLMHLSTILGTAIVARPLFDTRPTFGRAIQRPPDRCSCPNAS